MRIDINLANVELNSKNLQNLKKKVALGVKEGLRSAGKYITDEIKRQMELPKTGHTYIFTRGRRTRERSSIAYNREKSAIRPRKTLTYPAPAGLRIPSGSSYVHIASNNSGNESSAVLTGKLKNSIYNTSKGGNQQEIGAKAKHAAIQEFGSVKIDPRNNFRRPISQNKTQMANRIRNAINNRIMEIK